MKPDSDQAMTAGNQPSSSGSAGPSSPGTADAFLIVKRGLFFRPNCQGYTGIRDEAGRYSEEAARYHAEHGECTLIHADDAPEFMPAAYSDLVIKHLTLQRDEMRREVERLRGVAQASPDQRLTEDMTLAHNARKAAIEECARVATRAARRCVRERLPGDSVAAYIEREILALYAVTPSPGARAWTPDQFWEYVGGLAGEFEADQMRDMLAAKGLSITSTACATPRAPLNAIQFITLLEILEECAEHVTPELEARIKNVLGYHTDHDTVSSLPPANRQTGDQRS